MCKYSDETGYKCPHESLEGSEYCIFHLQDDNKDVAKFNEGISEILKTEEDSINFNGFYFPPETADFSNRILRNVVFYDAKFKGKADFRGAEFLGKAYFKNAKFKGTVDFLGVEFSEDVHFENAKFSDEVVFWKAIFLGKTYFEDVEFSGTADFGVADFSKKANFMLAKFSKRAFFWRAKFSEEVIFKIAIFSGKADFREATFLGTALFKHAIFLLKADFEETEFLGKLIFIPTNSEIAIPINFKSTFFSEVVRIKANLNQCTFIDSNIEKADLTGSTWPEKKGYKIIIWEEIHDDLPYGLRQNEDIYRRLKQSYQKYGDSDTAGKFYYQEMECKRKQMNSRMNLLWVYKYLCGYGEEPRRVIGASSITIFFFAFSYLFGGIEYIGSDLTHELPKLIAYDLNLSYSGFQMLIQNFDSILYDFLFCVYTSVITFTTLGYGDVHPIGWSRVFASIESGFGVFMTALFIFVFTRKMLR